MTKNKSLFIGGLVALTALLSSGSQAQEKAEVDDSQPSPSEQKITEALEKLVFVPHDLGAPEVTDAGGVRAVTVLPKVELLAPERLARTLSPMPTLYWHISKAPVDPVRFTLLADDPTAIDPLLEIEVEGIDQEGIYGISLEDHGLALESGKHYIWSVAISSKGESHSADMVAQTLLEHRADPNLAAALDGALPEDRAIRLAAEGYWYDTVDALSDEIDGTSKKSWQNARARLLDRAGLLEAAHFDWQKAAQ